MSSIKNNQKGFINLVLIGVIVLLVAVGGYFVWKKNHPYYATAEECQQKTGEQCLHDFGDSMPPDSNKADPVLLREYNSCMEKIPTGWFPVSKKVDCVWPVK
jgi:hypothetical protein